jgi:hypothetical protein
MMLTQRGIISVGKHEERYRYRYIYSSLEVSQHSKLMEFNGAEPFFGSPPVVHLLKNIPTFHGTLAVIIVFRRALY